MTTQDSKGRKIGYWVTTVLVALAMVPGGIADVMMVPDVIAGMDALGYPHYIAPFIGVAKILGAIAILAPKFPRLKEWAYAGIAVDLLGASYSHASSGDPIGNIMTPLVIFAIAMASWYLRPANRKLPDAKPA
jgi:uncharacterized membrane protein YphA (DoxX/SURF4 family)